MATLSEILTQCNVDRELYIGTAVLPRPLFVPDFDDDDNAGFIVDDILDNNDNITTNNDKSGDDDAQRLKKKKIGCATISTVEPSEYDPAYETHYARIISSEFNSIVIEHHLKWSPLVHSLPGPISQYSPKSTRLGRYDFGHVDTIVDWALSKQMSIKGHVLVWHVTSPVELLETMSPTEVSSAVKRHIFTTMGYYIDRIQMWDVVNEALANDGTLVQNIFYRKMGPNYIAQCFKWAHEANPNAFLIYNDNKVEGCCGSLTSSTYANQAKSDGYYKLLKSLVEDGIPIHGAGMQAHFDAAGIGRNKPPTPCMVKRQIHRIGQLGLKVNISEMDGRVSKLPLPPQTSNPTSVATTNIKEHSDMVQTTIYRDILIAALSEPCFNGIWFWGFSDRHTWVKNFYHDDTPLLYDEMYKKKPCYYGVVDALKTTTIDNTHDKAKEEKVDLLLLDDDDKKWGCDWMVQEPPSNIDDKKNNIHYVDTTKVGQPDWLQPN
jgi:endo-1,4-beta-xylanase